MKRLLALVLCAAALLTGCSRQQTTRDDDQLHILATTYPVYLFTCAITQGVDGVEVSRLINEEVSCLHDYTLTVTDMKAIERADIIVMNGAELEEFMEDALAQTQAVTIDCSEQIDLLPSSGHEHHDHHDDGDEDHHGHYDPHFWLSTEAAQSMLHNIMTGLCSMDTDHQATYTENYWNSLPLLDSLAFDVSALSCPYLITFHDGFQYFAHENGLTLLKAIEEEEGSTASAADIKEIVALIEEYDIPAIFVEKSGSDRTAKVISRETGVAVYQLDTLMSGAGCTLADYISAMQENYAVIQEALS